MSGSNLIAAHLDHSRSFADFCYVYPVISRRSRGLSIGVNLNPDKRCNFDCIYCEVDRTTAPRRQKVDLELLGQELRAILQLGRDGSLFALEPFSNVPQSWRRLNDIAFSGEGEPTTCPVFEEAVKTVWAVREELELGSVKMILITNAACLDRPRVQRGLKEMQAGAHEIWAKLDAGTDESYQAINRTHVPMARILRNITQTARTCPLYIQSLFLRRWGEPPKESEIRAYADRLNKIQARGGQLLGIQLYTIARPAPTVWATALSNEELNGTAALVRELTGLPCAVFYGTDA